jgi:outer membrane protein assembly factor BamB
MPQVIGDRVVIAGGTGIFQSLDKRTGKPVWSHDLYREFGASRIEVGYSCHALPYKDTLIMLLGGQRGYGVMAFDQKTGGVSWARHRFANAHSSARQPRKHWR